MKMDTGRESMQARVTRLHYAHGVTTAEIAVQSIQDGPEWTIPVSIARCPQTKGASIMQALARLLAGAVVMDGPDLLAIRDSIDNARGLASFLAPETDHSTVLLETIERAQYQVRGVLAS